MVHVAISGVLWLCAGESQSELGSAEQQVSCKPAPLEGSLMHFDGISGVTAELCDDRGRDIILPAQ